jgi:transcriptional regulator
MYKLLTYKELMIKPEARKGSADMLVLGVLDERERHGYEIARIIEARSGGDLVFHAATLYPTLHRLEARGFVIGRWRHDPGERRRRFYRITAAGRRALAAERASWRRFFHALSRVTRFEAR